MLVSATFEQESGESILFHPLLKAYPIPHSWIITAHISLGDLEKQWNMFIQQKARSQQLLNSLQWKPLAPSYLLSALQAESANLDSIYTSYKPLILTGTQLLKRELSFNGMPPLSKCTKRSLLPFLGDTLSWLTRTAITKDAKIQQANWNIDPQQETLVHVISIPIITTYAKQVNRQHINAVMENSWEDTQWCHYALQHHKFNIHPHKL